MSTQPVRRSPTRRDGSIRRAPAWALTIVLGGATVYVVLFAFAISQANTDMLGALTITPVLIATIVPIALRIARNDGDPMLFGIVMAAIVAKLLAAALRYYVAFDVYGNSDAIQYHNAALQLAPNFRRGIFDPGLGKITGTVFIKVVTGIVYAVLGSSKVTAFLIFAWMGFFGLLLLARAFRLAIPQGDSRRYLILVLFFPSLVYWPAAMGKEAWMMLAIGLGGYGVAGILRGRTMGIVSLGLGLGAALFVRPYIALMIFVGLGCAFLARRTRAKTLIAPMVWILALAAMFVVGGFLAGRTASFVDSELAQHGSTDAGSGLSVSAVSATLTNTEAQTADGGSEFSPVTVHNPLDMVRAFVTVFFRPFPFEATNPQSLASSAECLMLLGLFVWSWKRVRSTPRLFRSCPYLAFCVGYLIVFVFAFSSFSNFGILARQRIQALPFLLVFLALPEFQTLPSLKAARAARSNSPRPIVQPARRRVRRPAPANPVVAAPPPEPVRDGLVYERRNGAPSG